MQLINNKRIRKNKIKQEMQNSTRLYTLRLKSFFNEVKSFMILSNNLRILNALIKSQIIRL